MKSFGSSYLGFASGLVSLSLMFASGCATGKPGSFFGASSARGTNEALADSASEHDAPGSARPGYGASQGATQSRTQAIAAANRNGMPAGEQAQQAAAAGQSGSAPAQLASATRPALAPLKVLGPRESFQKVVADAPGVVLVDLYADWCGPCKTQGKILHGMEATAAKNQATILKINVDEHPELQQQFQVKALPTLLVLKDGKLVHRHKGLVRDTALLASWLAQ